MTDASPFSTRTASVPMGPRPTDEELDLYGLTHPGKVRSENQDQFLLCTVHPQVVVRGTSLPHPDALAARGQRLATLLLVADGVGGSRAGRRASELATQAMTHYLVSSLRSYHTAGSIAEQELIEELRQAAIEAHEAVRAEGLEVPERRDMATTLSLGIVIWPWLYVVQVGDSRCYLYADGRLRQVTRDQTLAQDLVDSGVMTPERAQASPLSHMLSSAIGAPEAMPEVTRVDVSERGSVILVCTDGLTKHVTDEEIERYLANMESAEQVCRAFVELALQRGGTDNITVVIGRALRLERRG